MILEWNLAYWQWDRWFFCAGYEYKFKDMEEIKLLTLADSQDRLEIPLGYIGLHQPNTLPIGTGTQALAYMHQVQANTEVEQSVSIQSPPIITEDMAFGPDVVFLTRTVYHPGNSSRTRDERIKDFRDTTEIFLSMRKRSDQAISTKEPPLMLFGPAIGPIHHLSRASGQGSQCILIEDLESYVDTDTFIIGAEYLTPTGSTVTLNYSTSASQPTEKSK